MLFWSLAAVLTLGASLAVLLPLTRKIGDDPDGGHDLEVYRDQLAELDRDSARGLIAPADAEQARAEIARRIIRINAEGERKSSPRPTAARLVGMAAVLAVPLITWGIYWNIGSPELPSQPLTERLAQSPSESPVSELVARAEAHLVANPSDGRGWDVLAPVYLRMGRANDSVTAYRNAIRLEGATAPREAGLGEAIASAAGGLVTAEAQAAFERALKTDPANPKARYYLATAHAQEGNLTQAVEGWQAMLAALPADSPWRTAAQDAIAQIESRLAAANGPPNASGPNQEDIDAAASMAPADRTAMIENMVAGLDEKLRQNPQDPEGWMRLVRSYQVLGKTDEARESLKRALSALGPDSVDGKKVSEFAASLNPQIVE